jgi:hypothetical protein
MKHGHGLIALFVGSVFFACSSSSSISGAGAGDGAAPGDTDGGSSAEAGLPGDDGGVSTGDGARSDGSISPTGRDWSKNPAILELGSFTTLYAMSDMHGSYADLLKLLSTWSLISGNPATPGAATWSGGNATLVMAGDMIDKGPQAPEIVDFMRALELSAAAAGGKVIVTLGNHEAEFLVDPLNSKATGAGGIDPELMAMSISPATYASGMDVHGKWLRERPFAVRVGKWFISHAGDTGNQTVAQLEAALRDAVDNHGFNAPAVIGASSILESKSWYTAPNTALPAQYALTVGAAHIVIGHTPAALGATGKIAADNAQATLVKIDCGIANGDSQGAILRVTHAGANEVAEELKPSGTVTTPPIYTGP